MKKIAVLGGSFNPPHNGHLRILKAASSAVNADISLMIPTFSPPHKPADAFASAKDRYNMCALCALEIGAEALDIELIRGGTSYTVDTLLALHEKYRECRIYLVMGADMLVTLKAWRRYDEIILLADIVAFTRSDTESGEVYALVEEIRSDGGKVTLLPLRPDGISSTEIRTRIREQKPINGLVPEAVEEYIYNHKLYENNS